MSDSQFRSLIYHIVGQPEDWQGPSVEQLHSLADLENGLDKQENYTDIKLGHQILGKLEQSQSTLNSFKSFLDDSRFAIVIFNQSGQLVFENRRACSIIDSLVDNKQTLRPALRNEFETLKSTNPNERTLKKVDLAYKPSNGDSDKVTAPDNVYITMTEANNAASPDQGLCIVLAPIYDIEATSLSTVLTNQYQISAKEKEVLACMLSGDSTKKAAERLHVSVNTVKTHKKSIFDKTNCRSQSAITNLFLNHELSQLENYFAFQSITEEGKSLNNGLFVTLDNDVELCYQAYGPINGTPVISLHRGYACRLNVPHDHKEILERLNIRLYIYDRPGYGRSPMVKAYPENHSDILEGFAKAMNLEQFALLANLTSAPLALDYVLNHPERVKSMSLISPIYIRSASQCKSLGDVLYPASRLVKVSKKMAGEIYRLWLKSVATDSEKKFKHIFLSTLGSKEQGLINDPRYSEVAIANFDEAFRLESSGTVNDVVYALTPRDLPLEQIKAPVKIWLGSDDSMIKTSLIDQVYSSVENKVVYNKQGHGSDLSISLFEEVLSHM